MCRHLAYLGAPRPLSELLFSAEHSLEVQSYAPKEMNGALLNADGFGVVWYAEGKPARYRSMLPLWADENIREMGHLRSGCVVANARSATPGMGMGLLNTPPFIHEGWTFSHNGYVRGFREGSKRALRRELSDAAYDSIRGTTDSEHLFAVFLDRVGTSGPQQAMAETARHIHELGPEAEVLLSLVATNGSEVVALRHAYNGQAPSLYVAEVDGNTWISSEPTFEASWKSIAAGLRVTADGVEHWSV